MTISKIKKIILKITIAKITVFFENKLRKSKYTIEYDLMILKLTFVLCDTWITLFWLHI